METERLTLEQYVARQAEAYRAQNTAGANFVATVLEEIVVELARCSTSEEKPAGPAEYFERRDIVREMELGGGR
jgi:hypothetical protein